MMRRRRRRPRGRAVALLLMSVLVPRALLAHEGPPFPIIVDAAVGPWLVSVWTDPDIGIGTFYVVFEAAEGRDWVGPTSVRIGVRPVSGRLAEAFYEATLERVRRGARYVSEVEFDRGEFWDVRVSIEGPEGGGELISQVEATPDGTIGPIGLVVYSMPFVIVAALWWRASVVRRRMTDEAAAGDAR